MIDCPESSCDCCCECGECEDEETGEFGQSAQPPWVERGHKVTARNPNENYKKVWPQLATVNFDPVQSAADFYLLESISNDVPFQHLRRTPLVVRPQVSEDRDEHFATVLELTDDDMKRWVKLRNKALRPTRIMQVVEESKVLLEDVIDMADAYLIPYFHIAIGGELRHHTAIGGHVLSSNRATAWAGWKDVIEEVGLEALLDAAKLFREFGGGSYGGDPWAVPCEVLYARLTNKYGDDAVSKRIFVDRAWTLEHNGGCFLNKIEWKIKDGNEVGQLGYMERVLNAQAADPTEYKLLVSAASPKVKGLFKEYWNLSREELNKQGVELGYGEDYLAPTPPKDVCNYCGSNPTFGHTIECGWVMGGKANGVPKGSIVKTVKDGDSYKAGNWFKDDSQYFFDANGRLMHGVDANDRFTVRFQAWANGQKYGSAKWVGTAQQFLNGDFSVPVKDIVKQCSIPQKVINDPKVKFLIEGRFRLQGDHALGGENYTSFFNDTNYGEWSADETLHPTQNSLVGRSIVGLLTGKVSGKLKAGPVTCENKPPHESTDPDDGSAHWHTTPKVGLFGKPQACGVHLPASEQSKGQALWDNKMQGLYDQGEAMTVKLIGKPVSPEVLTNNGLHNNGLPKDENILKAGEHLWMNVGVSSMTPVQLAIVQLSGLTPNPKILQAKGVSSTGMILEEYEGNFTKLTIPEMVNIAREQVMPAVLQIIQYLDVEAPKMVEKVKELLKTKVKQDMTPEELGMCFAVGSPVPVALKAKHGLVAQYHPILGTKTLVKSDEIPVGKGYLPGSQAAGAIQAVTEAGTDSWEQMTPLQVIKLHESGVYIPKPLLAPKVKAQYEKYVKNVNK